MNTDLIVQMTETFEGHAQHTEAGVEYWLARDLQHLLGYTEWRNFLNVLTKATTACEVSGHAVAHHFVDVTKLVELGSGSRREIDDVMLTRFACYLAAQNPHQMRTERAISAEHVTNNQAVRLTLLDRGIRPESLEPDEDIKKVERRVASDERKSLAKPDRLED